MENLVVSAKKKITMDKIISQVKVVTGSSVKKVLSSSARVVILSSDCSNNIVSISGKILVNVVYLNEENVVESESGFYEFADKQRANFSMSDLCVTSDVVIESINFSMNEVIFTVSHIAEVCGIYKYEMQLISEDSTDLVLKKSTFDSLKHVLSCEDNFVVAEECESSLKNVTVLSSNANIILNDVSCTVDKVVLEGKIVSEVVYKDEESVSSLNKEFDFKQEILAESAVPNMIADVCAYVKNITVTPEVSNEKTNFVYAVDIYAKCHVFEEHSYEIVSDMFSLKNELQTTYDYLELKCHKALKSGEETVVATADVSNVIDFDDVCNVIAKDAKILNVTEENEKTYIAIEISGEAVCKTVEGFESLMVKGQTVIEIEKEQNSNLGDIKLALSVSSFKVKAGKDLDVTFKIAYFAKTESEVSEKFVKSYEAKTEKTSNSYGIKVYVSKQGQTVFDVAKILNVKPETILAQNQVDDVFEQGEKVYVYSPVNLA